jgi:hypothetical protein
MIGSACRVRVRDMPVSAATRSFEPLPATGTAAPAFQGPRVLVSRVSDQGSRPGPNSSRSVVHRVGIRVWTPTVPLTVEYDLTDLGRSLVGVFLQLKDRADHNMDEVARSREDL